jgi:hypothetical protein
MDEARGTTEAVTQLLKNQLDMGDAFKPYYGNVSEDTLTVELKEHIALPQTCILSLRTIIHWHIMQPMPVGK